jgi:hypothetical protein
MFLISLPRPCHEDWDEMSPREHGAFCKACTKTVVDFTKLSDEEVKNYFFQHREQKTCGRFRNDQLMKPVTLPELLSRPIPFWKKFLAIVFILFGAFLSGCSNNGQSKFKSKSSISGANQSNNAITSVTLGNIIPDTSFGDERCTSVGTPVVIVTDGIIEPPLLGDVDIQIIEEAEIRPDTCIEIEEIKADTPQKNNPVTLKVDSVKKIMNPIDCDTIPTRAIEP